MQDPELPVRVQAALALTEMIAAHESIKTAVQPQVEKVIQGTYVQNLYLVLFVQHHGRFVATLR